MNLYESVTSNLKETENQILEKGTREDEPIVLVYREGAVQPYVVGINYYEDSNSWGYGYYFDNKEDAKKAFDFVCAGGNMHDFKLDEADGSTEDFRRNFSSNLTDYINKALSFKADNKKEDLTKLDDIVSSFKDDIDMVNNDFIEYINSNLNESTKVKECNSNSIKKEGEYEDIYGKPADYTEMRADITALRSICEKAKADGFNFADKFEQAINTLSDVCADLEDFYESTSKED